MAITRTAKGTAFAYDTDVGVNSVTLASVAIANAASVIVTLAAGNSFGAITSVTWNGQNLTQNAAVLNGTSVRCEIWSKHGVTGATGDVVATATSNSTTEGIMITVAEVSGVIALDKTSTGTGNSTSPSSGATATTIAADEILIGAVGQSTGGVAIGGTWDNSFSDGQAIDDASLYALSEGYRIVSSTGAYTASKTGSHTGNWAACIATFKAATNFTVTPDSVAITASLPAPTSAVVAVPASVGMLLSSSGGATNVLRKPASVEISTAASVHEAGMVADSYDPDAVTSQNFTSIRATTPSNLGDADLSTATGNGGTSLPAATGYAEVAATAFQQTPSQQQFGPISHIILKAVAWIGDIGPYASSIDHTSWPGWPTHPGTRFAYKVGVGSEAETPAINDDPAIGTGVAEGFPGTPAVGFVIARVPGGIGAGDTVVELSKFIHSAAITTKPGGGAWTWTDINNLSLVAVRWSWSGASPAFEFADLAVSEIWVDVYGVQGADVPPVSVRAQMLPAIVKTLKIESSI